MLVEFGKSTIVAKARKQPEKARAALTKVRTDGLKSTMEAIRDKLHEPIAMGYSNVGTVVEVGDRVQGYSIGDRVASNGPHAEFVDVPKNLCARVPDSVTDEQAAFTVIASIALQGIRLLGPGIGDVVAVTGLGLVGLLAVRLLRAHGCAVLAIDFDRQKLELAEQSGATAVDLSNGDDAVAIAQTLSRGRGIDGVIIAASTKSSDPVSQAARMCRQRGRIILVGVTGLNLSRDDFYAKELTFQVSCSYGPGRYDSNYELKGHDYPVGFVRWTEQRNFEAILDLLASEALSVQQLVSLRFPISNAAAAYERLSVGTAVLGLLLEYGADADIGKRTLELRGDPTDQRFDIPVIGAIGSGNYARRVLLPAFGAANVRFKTIASRSGVSATIVGSKLGFERSTNDVDEVLSDSTIDTVVIATRHNSHAALVGQALRNGKNVFVEKPLALTVEDLREVDQSYRHAVAAGQRLRLMVGFNRRFAPLTLKLKSLIARSHDPVALIYTVNAGAIAADHWTQDVDVGGGRIVGEACHFIDLARFLAASPISAVSVAPIRQLNHLTAPPDTVTITLRFDSGSVATIHYFSVGHRSVPKERIEVFQAGRTYTLDNFRSIRQAGVSRWRGGARWTQNKGQLECVRAFVQALRDGEAAPIAFQELVDVSQVSIDLENQVRGRLD